jgi:hypothetical protein
MIAFLGGFSLYCGVVFLLSGILNNFTFKTYRKEKEGYILGCYWYKKQLTKKAIYMYSHKTWDGITDAEIIETFLFGEGRILNLLETVSAFKEFFTLSSDTESMQTVLNIEYGHLEIRLKMQKKYMESINIVDRIRLQKELIDLTNNTEAITKYGYMSKAIIKRSREYQKDTSVSLKMFKNSVDRLVGNDQLL